MYTRSDNIEIMFGDDSDDITKQNKMRGSDFQFDSVKFLYYDFNKISLNRDRSYIDSPKWLKDKKPTINPKNNDDKCFQ